MTDTEIRKLRKKALIEMILNQEKENERLNKEITELKARLENKEICINNAGTIAEAAFEMNGVLEAAQAAAQQYLDNVKTLTERQEAECAIREKALMAKCIAQEQATHERCNFMKEETEQKCTELETSTKTRCEEMETAVREKCSQLEAETAAKCEQREKEAEEKYLALTQKAEQDVEAKWEELSARLEEFYRAHIGLKSLLTADAAVQRN